MGGLCSSLQLLKSQWRKVLFPPLTGHGDPVPVRMAILSYCEEASAGGKSREKFTCKESSLKLYYLLHFPVKCKGFRLLPHWGTVSFTFIIELSEP